MSAQPIRRLSDPSGRGSYRPRRWRPSRLLRSVLVQRLYRGVLFRGGPRHLSQSGCDRRRFQRRRRWAATIGVRIGSGSLGSGRYPHRPHQHRHRRAHADDTYHRGRPGPGDECRAALQCPHRRLRGAGVRPAIRAPGCYSTSPGRPSSEPGPAGSTAAGRRSPWTGRRSGEPRIDPGAFARWATRQ